MIEPTLNSRLSSAELCRRNGWAAGTRLVGHHSYGTATIEITAVGEEIILAKSLSEGPSREYSWSLHCRKWSAAETEGDWCVSTSTGGVAIGGMYEDTAETLTRLLNEPSPAATEDGAK